MNPEKALIIKIISHLLQYPDEFLHQMLDRFSRFLQEVAPGEAREALEECISRLRQYPLIPLQEEYSRLFDFNPDFNLNLTFHLYGDGRERGPALAELQHLYLQTGYSPITRELPDFLPLMLEFMSVCPDEVLARLVEIYHIQIQALAQRLALTASPYAALIHLAAVALWENNGLNHKTRNLKTET